uniref:Conopeptide n=1 Tax=Conus lenavati TaxID=1519839 RepID=A0A0K8TUU7_CONLV
MSKVGLVLLIFLVLLTLAALHQDVDDPRRQRDEKRSPQRDILRSTLRKSSYNIQRRCANKTPCSTCTANGQDCSVSRGGKGTCGTCVPRDK